MAKLQLKTAGRTADGVPRVHDKLHYGFDVKTGEDGYARVKDIIEALRKGGYKVNDRELVFSVGSELNNKFEKALDIVNETFESVAEFIANNDTQEIVNLITDAEEEAEEEVSD